MLNSIKIFPHFKAQELMTLLAGKVIPGMKTEQFKNLQSRKKKLAILYENGSPSITNELIRLKVQIAGKDVALQLRFAGSDVFVFQQVIVDMEYQYAIDLFRKTFLRDPQSIIDAGANIGLASLYFKLKCPASKVLAIEPDEQNATLVRTHISANRIADFDMRQSALWPEVNRLSIVNDFRDQLNWSLRVEPDQQGTVTTITPSQVLELFNNEVDLFKIDIEGGEAHLFRLKENCVWLKQVKMIAIEIHQEYIEPSSVHRILEYYGFEIKFAGELTLGINKNYFNLK